MPIPPQIAQNPFRILGVCGNASAKDRSANISKAKAFLRAGKSPAFPFDSADIFSEIGRTSEAVEQAESDLTIRENRIRCAQFWFVCATDKDALALGHIQHGKLVSAMNVWAHVGNVFSWQNRMICALVLNDWPQVARLAVKIYDAELTATRELFGLFDSSGAQINYRKFGEFFFGELRDLAGTETLIDALPANSAWREFVRAPETTPLIGKIRREICVARDVRGSNPEAALKIGENLENNTKIPLRELGRYFSKKQEEPLAGVSDELAEELSLCALCAFQNADGKEAENLRRALKLQKRAQYVAAGATQKSRVLKRGEELKTEAERKEERAKATEKAVVLLIEACNAKGEKTIAAARALWDEAFPKMRELESMLGVANSRFARLCKALAECIFACVTAETNASEIAETRDGQALLRRRDMLLAGTELLETLSGFVAGTAFYEHTVVPAIDALHRQVSAIEAVERNCKLIRDAVALRRTARTISEAKALLKDTKNALGALKKRFGAKSAIFSENLRCVIRCAENCVQRVLRAEIDSFGNAGKIGDIEKIEEAIWTLRSALPVWDELEKIAAGTPLVCEEIVPAREKFEAQIALLDDDENFIKSALAELETLPPSPDSAEKTLDCIAPHIRRMEEKLGAGNMKPRQLRNLVVLRVRTVISAFAGEIASSSRCKIKSLRAAAGTLSRLRELAAGTSFAQRELGSLSAEIAAQIAKNEEKERKRLEEKARRDAERKRKAAERKAKKEAAKKAKREAEEKKRREAEEKRKAEEATRKAIRDAAAKRAESDIDAACAECAPTIAAAGELMKKTEARLNKLRDKIGDAAQIFRRIRVRAAAVALSCIKSEADSAGTPPNGENLLVEADFEAAEKALSVLEAAAEALAKLHMSDVGSDFAKEKIAPATDDVNARISKLKAALNKTEKSLRTLCSLPLRNFDAVENLLEIVPPALRRYKIRLGSRAEDSRSAFRALAETAVGSIANALASLAFAARAPKNASRARILQSLADLRRAAELLAQVDVFAEEMKSCRKKIGLTLADVNARIAELEATLENLPAETPKTAKVAEIPQNPETAETPETPETEETPESVPETESTESIPAENSVPVPAKTEEVPQNPETPKESVPAEIPVPAPTKPQKSVPAPVPEPVRAKAEEEKLRELLFTFERRVESVSNAEELLRESATLLRAMRTMLGVVNPRYLLISTRIAAAALSHITRSTDRFRCRENMSRAEIETALRHVDFAAETLKKIRALDASAIFKNDKLVPVANDLKNHRAVLERNLRARNSAPRPATVPANSRVPAQNSVPAQTPQKSETRGAGIRGFFRRIFSD